jgi:epoxyqueuosine reductase QueG
MARPGLPEWSGEQLVYVSPREVLERFGFASVMDRGDVSDAEQSRIEAIQQRVPLQVGEPARERVAAANPADESAAIKARAHELGADMVGITRVDQHYVYEGAALEHPYAIVLAAAMDYPGEILKLPRPESNVEYLRVYELLSRITVALAAEIRERGFEARAHTLRDEQLAMLPHAQMAGLGELGKHGSLINRELGCSFRLGIVTTTLPLLLDEPKDEGIQDFCSSCRMCVSYCPGDAISDELADVRGNERWIVDTGKCAPFFSAHYGCAVCLQVCPINAKAFGSRFRDEYVATIAALDPDELRAQLSASIPAPAERMDRA